MKASTIGWAVVILIIIGGGVLYTMGAELNFSISGGTNAADTVPESTGQRPETAAKPAPPSPTSASPSPASGSAGVKDSTNQGNTGEAQGIAVGEPNGSQQPGAGGAEGSVVGDNLVLGTDGNEELGAYLIAYNGMTVYTFTKDTTSESVCYETCARNWPPYVIGAEDNIKNVKAGVDGKVGTTIRKDGSTQVTYNGHPLYFYANDEASGDVKGQNVGEAWFVVKP